MVSVFNDDDVVFVYGCLKFDVIECFGDVVVVDIVFYFFLDFGVFWLRFDEVYREEVFGV